MGTDSGVLGTGGGRRWPLSEGPGRPSTRPSDLKWIKWRVGRDTHGRWPPGKWQLTEGGCDLATLCSALVSSSLYAPWFLSSDTEHFPSRFAVLEKSKHVTDDIFRLKRSSPCTALTVSFTGSEMSPGPILWARCSAAGGDDRSHVTSCCLSPSEGLVDALVPGGSCHLL